jgi:tetratricopeptide (TPR) repeat protein
MTENDQPAWVNPRLVRPYGWSPKLHLDLAKMPEEQRQFHVLSRLSCFAGLGRSAERCYHFYTNGQAEPRLQSTYKWTPWTAEGMQFEETTIESLQELTPYIPDEEIVEVCQALVQQRQLLDDINDQLGQALLDFLGLSPPTTVEGFRELGQRVDDYRLEHGPAWAGEAEIQPLIIKLKDLFVKIKSLEYELTARLQPWQFELYARLQPSGEEIGDERAKDLVDEAVGEPDPDRAIRLLEKALRYGETGMQASSAYMELAGRYSDLGDTERAIEHYTKSIEAYKDPNAFALYWRGELYYQQEEWGKARSDFERAVAIGLYSPEYEQAQEYLSELRARDSGA